MQWLSYLCRVAVAFLAIVLVMGCATGPGGRIDNIPMYGQPGIPRPDILKRADDDFIRKASEGLGSRENASKTWAIEGDRFMSEGNLDFAMRRYNQAWLLNSNNFQPYWGFGRVLLELGKLDEALEHFETANKLIDDPYQKVALLADTATAYSTKGNRTTVDNPKERAKYFNMANQFYEGSVRLDATYPNAWRSWARSLYFEGRYAEAWDKVKKAKSLKAPAFPPSFIKALDEKMPEPK
jgi:tetratricopeptide (TPR) repeat protein